MNATRKHLLQYRSAGSRTGRMRDTCQAFNATDLLDRLTGDRP